MKRTLSLALAIVMLLGCVFTLASCGGSAYTKLEKAFVKEGYEVDEELGTIIEGIKAELEKNELEITVHRLEKDGILIDTSVVIIEFKSTKELAETYKNSDTLKGLASDIKNNEDVNKLYDSMVEAGIAKGNCLILPLSIVHFDEITEIVKGA